MKTSKIEMGRVQRSTNRLIRSYLSVLFVLLLLSSGAYGSDSSHTFIGGVIVDNDGLPVENALITINTQDSSNEFSSEKNGEFLAGPYPEGTRVYFTASAPGHGMFRSDDVVSPTTDLNVVLSKNGTLIGQVVDASTLQPISNFSISFHKKEAAPLRTAAHPGTRFFDHVEGKFEWEDVYSGNWTISVESPGYQPLTLFGVQIPANGYSESIKFRLNSGKSIFGEVLEYETMSPVVGATVTVDKIRTHYDRSPTELPQFTNTLENGTFSLVGIPQGANTLKVTAPGFVDKIIEIAPDSFEPILIELHSGSVIDGVVFDSDGITPAIGMVTLWNIAAGSGMGIPLGPDGEFMFSNVAPGNYQVFANTAKGSTERLTIQVASLSDIRQLVLQTTKGGTVTGRVSGLLEGETAKIHIKDLSGKLIQEVAVNENGDFFAQGVPNEAITLNLISSIGRLMTESLGALQRENGTSRRVDFVLEGNSTLSGTLTRQGKPVRFVEMSIIPLDGQTSAAQAETTVSGQFLVEYIQDGRYKIKFSNGHVEDVLVSGETNFSVDIPAYAISGEILNAATETPIQGVELRLYEESTSKEVGSTTSNYRGHYTFSVPKTDRYLVSVYKPGFKFVTRSIEIAPTDNRIDLSMVEDGDTLIQVTDLDSGLPLKFANIWVMSGSAIQGRFDLILDSEGVGQIPNSLLGKDLTIGWFGYENSNILDWGGQPLEVQLHLKN